MAPGLGARLRHLARQFRDELEPIANSQGDIRDAAIALEAAVVEAFPEDARRRRGRTHESLVMRLKRKNRLIKYLRAQLVKSRRQVTDLLIAKQAAKDNRMTPEFLAKVCLSWPTTCARGFASAWQDLVGVGVSGCTRPTITKIRDAFVETIKEMNVQDVVAFLQHRQFARQCSVAGAPDRQSGAPDSAAGAPARQSASSAAGAPDRAAGAPDRQSARQSSAAGAPALLCAALLHIHDEASLRLRSSDDNGAMPSRSRSSKVQQHSVFVQTLGQEGSLRFLTELDALSNKSAVVLANSLHKVLRDAAAVVGKAFSESAAVRQESAALRQRPWLMHILVSDGLGTNEAAAKIVLSWILANPLPNDLRYFVVLVKCANHQVNLAVSSVVCGRAALIGVQNCSIEEGNPLAQRPRRHDPGSCASNVCGATVRLYKVLISDYYADFLANLQEIVSRLRACSPSAGRHAARQRWEGLSKLYGPSVFPPGLLDVLNGGLGDWSTHLSAAEAPASAAEAPASAAAAPVSAPGALEAAKAQRRRRAAEYCNWKQR